MSDVPQYVPKMHARLLWAGVIILIYGAVLAVTLDNYVAAAIAAAVAVYGAWVCHAQISKEWLFCSFLLVGWDILLFFLCDRPIRSDGLRAAAFVAFLTVPAFLVIVAAMVTRKWWFACLLLLLVTPLDLCWLFFRDYLAYMPERDMRITDFVSIGLIHLRSAAIARLVQLGIVLASSFATLGVLHVWARYHVGQPKAFPEERPRREMPRRTRLALALVAVLIVAVTLVFPPWVTYESFMGTHHGGMVGSSRPPDPPLRYPYFTREVFIGWRPVFSPPEVASIAVDGLIAEEAAVLLVVGAALLIRNRKPAVE